MPEAANASDSVGEFWWDVSFACMCEFCGDVWRGRPRPRKLWVEQGFSLQNDLVSEWRVLQPYKQFGIWVESASAMQSDSVFGWSSALALQNCCRMKTGFSP